MCVTLSTADDFEELTELWEASVRATHHFIPEQYILKLKPLVWSVYLRSMPVYTVRGSEPGFISMQRRLTYKSVCPSVSSQPIKPE